MSNYIPGSAYSLGYLARMKGGNKPTNTVMEQNNVYWEEWLTGWDDAHNKIISEARANADCSKPNCCKNFIQD